MKKLTLLLGLAAVSCYAQASFTVKVGSEPTVTVSMTADAVTSITAAITNITASPAPTTLAVAALSTDTVLHLTSGAGITAGMGCKLESEIVGVASVSVNDITVVRGQIGTTAAAHVIGTATQPLRNGLYGEFIANLVADAIRVSMVQYPAATIAAAQIAIATQNNTIAATVAAGVSHTP
jgi:hypothetical protein